MTYYERKTCRLCHGKNLDMVLDYGMSPLADEYLRDPPIQMIYPLRLYLCHDCANTQLNDVVKADAIYPQYTYETKSSLGLVQHFERYAEDTISKIQPPAGGLVVDIGSNDGTLLRAFRGLGMKVLGIDPAPNPPNDVLTLPRFFDEKVVREIGEKAVIITANNIVANVDDLETFIENVKLLLAKDGVFIFESFYLGDLIRNMVFDFIYHEHLSAFSVRPLRKFFNLLDMELIDVQSVLTKGGSMRYTVQHRGGPRPLSKTVNGIVENELHYRLNWPGTFVAFEKNIEAMRIDLTAVLEDLPAGSTIAGYGASATSTTFLYRTRIGRYLDYLVDDLPVKQGTCSPGLHLPVLSPDQLKADYCVILAWRYADNIIARNKDYQNRGGRFIVPLPSLQVTHGLAHAC